MIPAEYNFSVYRGDTFNSIVSITLPDLTPLGGPATLEEPVEVKAQIRTKESSPTPLAEITIDVVDAANRIIKPTIPADITAEIIPDAGVWDLQVMEGEWVGTILKGAVKFLKQVTR